MAFKDKARQIEYTRDYYQRKRADPEWVAAARQRSLEYLRTKVTPELRMLASARERAKKQGLPFDIELADIVIPEVCPLLGIPLVSGLCKGKKGPTPESPSLDRLRPELGYVKGNVWVISHRANGIKHNATPDELKLIAAGLEARLG
jgi:hypothetical protein